MSQENAEVVRRFLSRINDGDVDAALADVSPDAELDWSNSHAPDGGVYRGHAAWRMWLRGREEGLSELRFDITEVIEGPPGTVIAGVRVLGRGRASGVEVEALGAGVWQLRDGTIAALTLYQTWDEAHDDAPGA